MDLNYSSIMCPLSLSSCSSQGTLKNTCRQNRNFVLLLLYYGFNILIGFTCNPWNELLQKLKLCCSIANSNSFMSIYRFIGTWLYFLNGGLVMPHFNFHIHIRHVHCTIPWSIWQFNTHNYITLYKCNHIKLKVTPRFSNNTFRRLIISLY